MKDINELFGANTVEEIIANLKRNGSEWAVKTAETLEKMSPTSLKITMKGLEDGGNLDLQECLQVEYRLSQRCCEDHDFVEGMEFELDYRT
jgi:3-hydroxyisobutyryl-CoA hydrolase